MGAADHFGLDVTQVEDGTRGDHLGIQAPFGEQGGDLALDEDTDAGVGTHQPVDTGDVDMVGVLVGDEHGVEVVEGVPGVAVHTGIDEHARRGGLHEHGGMPQATQLHVVEYATGPTRSGDRHYGFRALVTRSEVVA